LPPQYRTDRRFAVDDWGKAMSGKNRIMERRMSPTSDAERYAVLQHHYHDLVAGVRMIRAAAEQAYGLQLPSRMTVNEGCEAIARAIYEAADRPRPSPVTDHKTRIYFQHRIDAGSDDGEDIVEHLAGVEDFEVAHATYRAACERWPNAVITLPGRSDR
jgi:hypothetical protein